LRRLHLLIVGILFLFITVGVGIADEDLLAEAAGPYTGIIKYPISFTGSATGGTGDYTAWHWEFGDGKSSTEQNPDHTYKDDNTYTATLTVTDNVGATADDTAEVTVGSGLAAEANGPYSGPVGVAISFSGSASGGTDPYTYSWDFGDGESSEEQNPDHTYKDDDTYTATLTVTDNVGSTADDKIGSAACSG